MPRVRRPAAVPAYSSRGIEVHIGDLLDVVPRLGRFDAVATDPPYGLEFMGADWDRGVPGERFWRVILGAAKPGAHLLAFGGTRTFHRLTCAIEDAGFEIRDCLSWLYGTGFPKSLNVSKAIDRRRDELGQIYRVTAWIRATRDAVGATNREIDAAFGTNGMARHWTDVPPHGNQPAVPTLEQVPRLLEVLRHPDVPGEIAELLIDLNGRKGQPGEAWFRREVIRVRRDGAGNTGREAVPILSPNMKVYNETAPATPEAARWEGWGTALKPGWEPVVLARRPLDGTVAENVLRWGVGALHVDACRVGTSKRVPASPRKANKHQTFSNRKPDTGNEPGYDPNVGRWPANVAHDGSEDVLAGLPGESSRFFYRAKVSRAERGPGNDHPTVKPVALMRWLLRLVVPPGGVVLDPFAGSGSTLLAARAEGFRAVGVELDPRYAAIAVRRLRTKARA